MNNFQAVQFSASFHDISPLELEEILEYLDDRGYLTKQGKDFRDNFYEVFIKE